jgi:predicted DNA-binding protein (UPF0251 family)
VSAVPPPSDRFSDLFGLRQFGLALARDDRFVLDHAAAEALVARLFRQASMEAVANEGRLALDRQDRQSGRVRAFGQFVRLYRRQLRRLALDDRDDEAAERPQCGAPAGGLGMAAAVRMLPLELREALLIVVLARFTHREAALALDIPLAALISRLTRARERLAVLTRAATETKTADVPARAVSHLRVVK